MTAIDGLILLRSDHAKPPSHIISRPALCVVAQGAKWTSFREERHGYRAGEALIVTVEMPSVGRVVEASPDQPFLGAVIEFDLEILSGLLEEMGALAPEQIRGDQQGAFVIEMDRDVTDCVLRMVRLLSDPKAIPILSPMLKRELGYRLLTSPSGSALIQMAFDNGHPGQILRSIGLLRDRFSSPLRIADLA
ncbi:AraC family transcriptional regulator [Marinomonas transparens]|uniref:AraC family transcriptional regulator n=1 Tax=Marinomonas transparens TaxID=2795388 RepID=A0A934JN96_9GAMM|nr:AraC family transcriptional regulator [Marinomonas transparens]MBJ7537119.1 AraC family transcriptional regulator [Marinomonas transparens]